MNPTTRRDFPASPFAMVERAFEQLCTGRRPLALDGAAIGHDMPAVSIRLDRLRVMLDGTAGFLAREAAWHLLAERAQTDGAPWVLGACGVMLPGLRRLAGEVARGYRGDTADIDAEVLAGFVAELHRVRRDDHKIVARLAYAGYNAGRRFRYREIAYADWRRRLDEAIAPVAPSGHPDFVLAAAVRAGIITRAEAELIGRTRLDDKPLSQVAADLGVAYPACWMRRERAEARLVEAITNGDLEDAGTFW